MSKHIKLYALKLCSFACQLYLNKLIFKKEFYRVVKECGGSICVVEIFLSDKVERHNNMYIVVQNSTYQIINCCYL